MCGEFFLNKDILHQKTKKHISPVFSSWIHKIVKILPLKDHDKM